MSSTRPAAGRTWRFVTAIPVLLVIQLLPADAGGQEPGGPVSTSIAELRSAIGRLGDLSYSVRAGASRTIRRATASQAVPLLADAVQAHADGFVRYRALVLLTGFGDPQTRELMKQMVRDPNDRLRQVAYAYFEHNPDPEMAIALLGALDREEADLVRPALVRALASLHDREEVREALLREVTRGEDFFRSAVIEALGDHRAGYAVGSIVQVAKAETPLQHDAALALGRIGDRAALPVLAELQRSAGPGLQPALSAAVCLLGADCAPVIGYLSETLRFGAQHAGYQEIVRASAGALRVLATSGNTEALQAAMDIGVRSDDPVRASLALALGGVALRNSPLLLEVLEKRADRGPVAELLREGFDMLEEDFEEEQFFVVVRRLYWRSPDGSSTKQLAELLIRTLEF
jgi:hypothetical protein